MILYHSYPTPVLVAPEVKPESWSNVLDRPRDEPVRPEPEDVLRSIASSFEYEGITGDFDYKRVGDGYILYCNGEELGTLTSYAGHYIFTEAMKQ